MAGADPFYHRDTIGTLKQRAHEGAWATRAAKLRLLKTEIEALSKGGERPKLLDGIEAALERIRDGIYDVCSVCGRRIAETRARTEGPWITTCPSCHGKKP